MRVLWWTLLAICVSPCPVLAAQAASRRPWLSGVATPDQVAAIHTLRAEAEVDVSAGAGFRTTAIYHDPRRVAFRAQDSHGAVTTGVEGKYVWTFDGNTEQEADAFAAEFALGHQFHAQILFFDRLHPSFEVAPRATFGSRACSVVKAGSEDSLRALYYDSNGLPLGMRMHHGATHITIEFEDWREVGGPSLPFLVRIDDGRAQFEYRYTDVRINAGSLGELRAPLDRLTNEQALLRLHRTFMDGHFFGRADDMQAGLAESFVQVGRGEVLASSGEQALQALEGLLQRVDYTAYEDRIRPVVRVSDDGTLGWVIVQVAARGVQLDEGGKPAGPVDFVSAWVELYEKVEGSWRMSGNVSTFRP